MTLPPKAESGKLKAARNAQPAPWAKPPRMIRWDGTSPHQVEMSWSSEFPTMVCQIGRVPTKMSTKTGCKSCKVFFFREAVGNLVKLPRWWPFQNKLQTPLAISLRIMAWRYALMGWETCSSADNSCTNLSFPRTFHVSFPTPISFELFQWEWHGFFPAPLLHATLGLCHQWSIGRWWVRTNSAASDFEASPSFAAWGNGEGKPSNMQKKRNILYIYVCAQQILFLWSLRQN